YPTEPQFESMKDAIHRLTRLCEDVGVEFEDITLTGSHRTAASELIALERELWAFGMSPDDRTIPAEEARGHIQTYICPTLYDEAQAAALHILELVQKGVAYEEIAVVVRDTAAWEGVLDAALEQYQIPYFLSDRTDLNEKPAARLLLIALRCIARRWQTEDIMALCKTGLLSMDSRELDYFAEYVDTWRLGGKHMLDNGWSMNPDGYTVDMSPRALLILQAANRVRDAVMKPLLVLEDKLRTAESVTDQCRALYEYLCELEIKAKLSDQAEEYLSLGQVREAGEQVRLWSFLTETLATIASVMQEAEPLTSDELSTALSLVFADTDIGSVPARHDCVTVGSAATLRVDHMKAMLVLGLCEGEFPQSVKEDGLLTEQNKETLCRLGIELDSRAARLTSDELLYVWRAFTKPSDTLILSCSTATPDGQSRAPSAAFTRIKYLFPYIEPSSFSSTLLGLAESTRHRTPVEDFVSKPTARRLLGEEIWLSQSRLQTYARCPYSYYGSHILRLRERGEAKFDNLGAGVFLHHVMEQYLRLALDEQNRLRPMDDTEVIEVADAVISAYIEELCGDISESGRLLHLFDRLRQVALMLIENIQAELRQSAFRVAGLEWDTHGRRAGDPRPMILSLETEDETDGLSLLPTHHKVENEAVRLLLGGRIDRVDLYRAEDGETVYVRVIDYKSSKHEFTTKSVTEDMNIQLLLYLFTLCSPENRSLFSDEMGRVPKQVLPASAVYISPDESDRGGAILPCRTGVVLGEPEILEAANSDEVISYLPSVKRNKSGEFTGKGLCSRQQLGELEDLLKTAIRATADAMYSGKASRTPSDDACKYCRMKRSCGVCQTQESNLVVSISYERSQPCQPKQKESGHQPKARLCPRWAELCSYPQQQARVRPQP
ncbi:MAG: PD-(D/E)XK nuclease family protein, partial [Clostridia bacterium]|nr:PD-(D/E)XK nuclease family protein [Clostridia bacterium]